MRIALTVTNGRIASLFETARGLRVVTREGNRRQVEDVALPGPSAAERVAQVLDTGADLVVTGGIARMFRWMLEGRGVSVLPWIVGPADEVVDRLGKGEAGARRIAVSAKDAKPDAGLEPCFGRAPFFGVCDPETGGWEYLPADPGGETAEVLARTGLQAVVTGTIGPIAAGVLTTAGVAIARAGRGTLEELVAAWESGCLDDDATDDCPRLLASAGAGSRRRSRQGSAPAVHARCRG